MPTSIRRLAVAVSLMATLLAPATGAFAAHHGGPQGQGHQGVAGHHGQGTHERHGAGRRPPGLEGVIVSIAPDNSQLTLRPPATTALSVTVLISSSTVITADAGVTTTMLAVGEQVHIAARHEGNALVALRIEIQRLTGDAACSGGPNGDNGGEPDSGAQGPEAGQGGPAGGKQNASNQAPGCGPDPRRGNGGGDQNNGGPGNGGPGNGGPGAGCDQGGNGAPGTGGSGNGVATSQGDNGNQNGANGECGPGNGGNGGPGNGGNGSQGGPGNGQGGPGNGQGGPGQGGNGGQGGDRIDA